MKIWLTLLPIVVILSACSTGPVVTSKRIAVNHPTAVIETTGAYYSLPRIRVRVIIEQEILHKDGKPAEYRKPRRTRARIPTDPNVQTTINQEQEVGEELPVVVIEPDPRHFYVLDYLASSGANDDIEIHLTGSEAQSSMSADAGKPEAGFTRFAGESGNGQSPPVRGRFLEKIDVKTEDQAAELIEAFVDVAKAAVFRILEEERPPAGAAGFSEKEGEIWEWVPLASMLIDPADACRSGKGNDPKDRASIMLSDRYGLKCALHLGGQAKSESLADYGTDTPNGGKTPTDCTGVCFRPELHYELVFYYSPNTDTSEPGVISGIYSLTMPNAAPVLSLDVTRAAFVEKHTVLDFDHGLLKKVTIDKPSEAVGFAMIPVNIAKAILAIPAELIRLRVNIDDEKKSAALSETSLVTQQKLLIDQQAELIKSQRALQELQKGEQ